MPQNIQKIRGVTATLAVAVLICAGSPYAGRAGDNGSSATAPPRARKQLSPLELHEIQERCFHILYKIRFAGEPLVGPPTTDQMERMIHTPAFRACVERFVKAKESGY